MTSYPPRPSGGPGWVDPDAPTSLAPQQKRPQQPPGPQSPPQPPAATPPLQQPAQWAGQAPPPGQWPGQAPQQGQWPQQPPPNQHQQPWPGTPGPGGPYGGFQGPGAPPPPTNRKPLIIGVAVAVVVAIVVVIGVVSLSGNGSGSGDGRGGPSGNLSASDTAKAYLEALSSGDAAKALSFGSAQPSTTDLLTDDILRKQNAKMPISNIRILDEDKALAGIGQTTVHVAVNFGQVVDDATIDLKQDANQVWKLETAAIKLDPPFNSDKGSAEETVTIFGKDFKKGSLYAFPGYLGVGSSNEYLTVTAEPILLEGLRTYLSATLDPEIKFNDDGRQAIMKQLTDAFANCQGSNQLAPPNCPTKVAFSDAVDGTVNWGARGPLRDQRRRSITVGHDGAPVGEGEDSAELPNHLR